MLSVTELRRASDQEIAKLQSLLDQDTENSVRSVRNGSDFLGETVFAILHGGEYAGFCTYRGAADEIFPLVVFNQYRRKGIGFAAMQQLINLLKAHQVQEVGIEVLPGAELFWKSVFAGFPEKEHFGGSKFTYTIQ
ncbi:GNAT family N-acetyltransferase [Pseudomonas chlororaphis]|uniref:GNAT family N-acetyltransferase n=1 Tax=Pseudomonas chlororaphis TaxID=587753 RepID=UPI0023681A0B|nr:GNAT family N-acetyltransferase [Pseudomonas chlororaphis]WDH55370.1 GNAT family N-acetyltransferase [Pseudomonas chlororaphis]